MIEHFNDDDQDLLIQWTLNYLITNNLNIADVKNIFSRQIAKSRRIKDPRHSFFFNHLFIIDVNLVEWYTKLIIKLTLYHNYLNAIIFVLS